jgi:hypothetical protein
LPLEVQYGGTGATNAADALKNLGAVSESNVVNNFTTTEEGFVADARALKVLNDTKLSMELLWENASPESSFAAQTLSLDLSSFDRVVIDWRAETAYSSEFSTDTKVGETVVASYIWGEDGTYGHRDAKTSNDEVEIQDGYANKTKSDGVGIPCRIYGIKGVFA